MRRILLTAALLSLAAAWPAGAGGDEQPDRSWRALPLITGGKVDPAWVQVGWGGFAVEGDSLRTDCVEQGMGLLLYRKERLGDCQIRVVYRTRDARSNSGVFVRIHEDM